jgi:Tol biopolymer transport system component
MLKRFGSHFRHNVVACSMTRAAPLIWLGIALFAFADVAHAAFPGQNGQIAFQSFRDNSFRSDIHVINPDGTGQLNVTNFPNAQEDRPAWSADGTKLALTSNRTGTFDIFRMAADGTGLTQLTFDSSNSFYPAWSPSGAQIAFMSDRFVGHNVFSMFAADGSEQVNVTANQSFDGGPAWSPGGGQIAFTSTRDGNSEVYVMNTDGTSQVNLTLHPALDTAADWSPDGSHIVFSSERDGNFNSEVYVMDADGTDQIRLTNSAGFDGHPAWSPDGTKIAFTSNRLGNFDVYVMNADGSALTRVTTNAARDMDPSWQPVFGDPEPTDTTNPTIAITSPADGAHHLLGTSLIADFACADEGGGSGLATCAGAVADGTPLDTSTVGPHRFTVTATDNAGNDASLTHDYRIVYPFGGFQAPVDGEPTLNTAKAGSVIPVKFTLGGDQGLGILADGSPTSSVFDCATSADLDEIEQTESVGSGLSYDPDTGAYKYNWKTSKDWAGTCRAFDLELADGTHHQALFSFH